MTASRVDTSVLSSSDIDAAVRAAVLSGQALYAVDEELVRELSPDVVITQDLCHVCAVSGDDVGKIRSLDAEVISLDPRTIADVESTVVELGDRLDAAAAAAAVIERMRGTIAAAVDAVAGRPPVPVFVAEWLDPPFAAGHWVPEMVALAGGREVLGRTGGPSFPVTWDDVAAAGPELVVVAPCGFDAGPGRGGVGRASASRAGRSPSRPTPTTRGRRRAWPTASPSSPTSSTRTPPPTRASPPSRSKRRGRERDCRAPRPPDRDRLDQPGARARRRRRGRDRGLRGGLARRPRPRGPRRRGRPGRANAVAVARGPAAAVRCSCAPTWTPSASRAWQAPFDPRGRGRAHARPRLVRHEGRRGGGHGRGGRRRRSRPARRRDRRAGVRRGARVDRRRARGRRDPGRRGDRHRAHRARGVRRPQGVRLARRRDGRRRRPRLAPRPRRRRDRRDGRCPRRALAARSPARPGRAHIRCSGRARCTPP